MVRTAACIWTVPNQKFHCSNNYGQEDDSKPIIPAVIPLAERCVHQSIYEWVHHVLQQAEPIQEGAQSGVCQALSLE